jgi:hypothetical protein
MVVNATVDETQQAARQTFHELGIGETRLDRQAYPDTKRGLGRVGRS